MNYLMSIFPKCVVFFFPPQKNVQKICVCVCVCYVTDIIVLCNLFFSFKTFVFTIFDFFFIDNDVLNDTFKRQYPSSQLAIRILDACSRNVVYMFLGLAFATEMISKEQKIK